MASNKNRTKKNKNKNTYKKKYRKIVSRRRRYHMKGGTILEDLKNNFNTLKSNFTNNLTTQLSTKLSMFRERARQRFTKVKDTIKKKINCIKND